MAKRIRSKNPKKKKINISSLSETKIDYPIFCFKHLQTNFQGDSKFYFDFIERLKKISNLSWNEINTTQRHGFGTEKMPTIQIKPNLPVFITPDVTDLLVFRANGDNRPFLGIRKQNIFHIIFIEERFGDVYNH